MPEIENTTPAADDREDFYLWHLVRLGVLNNDTHQSEAWEAAKDKDRVIVAIIDSGVDTGHPNLTQNLMLPQIDFTPHLYGAFYHFPFEALREEFQGRDGSDGEINQEIRGWAKRLRLHVDALSDGKLKQPDVGETGYPTEEIGPGPVEGDPLIEHTMPSYGELDALIDGAKNEHLNALWDAAKASTTITIPIEDPSRFFGAHGTACAGLIGGHGPKKTSDNTSERAEVPGPIAYYGVNPYCCILPICTPYSHEILPVINALLYAFAKGAQVIHIPRGLPDYSDRVRLMEQTHSVTRIDRPAGTPDDHIQPMDQADLARLKLHSEILEFLLREMSKRRIVVLSAGNDGWRGKLSYPARIHSRGEDSLIVVGAVNRGGYKSGGSGKKTEWRDYISSYSNGRDSGSNMVHVLSDDGFALDKKRVAFDEQGRWANDYSYRPHLPPNENNNYSSWGLLTLDVRGSYGYAAGRLYDPPENYLGYETGDLYTVFGGTSAASALAAGLLSLHLQKLDPSEREIDESLIERLCCDAGLS